MPRGLRPVPQGARVTLSDTGVARVAGEPGDGRWGSTRSGAPRWYQACRPGVREYQVLRGGQDKLERELMAGAVVVDYTDALRCARQARPACQVRGPRRRVCGTRQVMA